ncbi:response regulator [Cupriavidus sp. 2TAF22]|uniref:response regulator n=1 Tax=unclassified Cupriavidus TaxID=2640874 RepID=UPI003F901F7A
MKEFSMRVIVADDHPAVALGITYELRKLDAAEIVATVGNSTELIAALDTHACDVLVSDYVMPGGQYGDGLTLVSFLQRRYPGLRLVILTMMDNPGVVRAIHQQGVNSILSKSDAMSHLLAAVHAAYANGKYFSPTIKRILDESKPAASIRPLTAREAEVVRLFGSGQTVNEIAAQLHRSKQTVSSQKASAMRKLGITRDADLILYASDGSLAGPGSALAG